MNIAKKNSFTNPKMWTALHVKAGEGWGRRRRGYSGAGLSVSVVGSWLSSGLPWLSWDFLNVFTHTCSFFQAVTLGIPKLGGNWCMLTPCRKPKRSATKCQDTSLCWAKQFWVSQISERYIGDLQFKLKTMP